VSVPSTGVASASRYAVTSESGAMSRAVTDTGTWNRTPPPRPAPPPKSSVLQTQLPFSRHFDTGSTRHLPPAAEARKTHWHRSLVSPTQSV
jgi:hypothetical protein